MLCWTATYHCFLSQSSPAAYLPSLAQLDGPLLFSEITNPLGPRAPYFSTLPAHTEVFSFYEMPVEYAPVIQHAATVRPCCGS